jgi:hypothetical protein
LFQANKPHFAKHNRAFATNKPPNRR